MSATDARRLCLSYLAYHALGAESIDGPGYRAVRQDLAPLVHDVNHLQVDGECDASAALAFLEQTFADRSYRKVITTPFASPGIEALLAERGFVPDVTLQGLLRGGLSGPKPGPGPTGFEIRPVLVEDDWRQLDRLARADHAEQDSKRLVAVYSGDLTAQIQSVRRLAADAVHFFMAWVGEEPVGYLSSWPGLDGLGMVEDLFTMPAFRGRGVARALIHHCVSDARARGAGEVLIGSDPNDTPKLLYAAMGFEPTCLTRGWLRSGVSAGG